MMDYQDLDVKLRTLIKLSKKNEDSRRAAVVFYLLIRRILNEKGVKLGFAPLISKKYQKAFYYMKVINGTLEKTFNFKIFHDDIVKKVQNYELLYLNNPLTFSFDSLKELVNIYYDLRKIEVPNVHGVLQNLDSMGNSHALHSYQFFSRGKNGFSGLFSGKKEPNHVKQFLSLDLNHKEAEIKDKLKKQYDKESFETLLQYKKMKQEVNKSSSGKILFKGSLKNNVLYQYSLNEIPGFFLVGLAIVMVMISIILFMQEVIYPQLSGGFSLIAFLLFGSALILVVIYWKLFYAEMRR